MTDFDAQNDDQEAGEDRSATDQDVEDGALDEPEQVDEDVLEGHDPNEVNLGPATAGDVAPLPNDDREFAVQSPEGVVADVTPENTTEATTGKKNL